MTATFRAHALNKTGSKRNGTGLQQTRVDVLTPQAILVGGALLHELTTHFLVLLLEQDLDFARFVYEL